MAKFEYISDGTTKYYDIDIVMFDKYEVTNYKDSVLSSGSVLTDEETHDYLEDVLEYMNPKRNFMLNQELK